jgi:hypothetical protein
VGVVDRDCTRYEAARNMVRAVVLGIIGVLFFIVSGCGADKVEFPTSEAQPSAEMLLKVSGSQEAPTAYSGASVKLGGRKPRRRAR